MRLSSLRELFFGYGVLALIFLILKADYGEAKILGEFSNTIPKYWQIFFLINIALVLIATIMVLEVKKISISDVWDRIFFGNIALIGLITSLTLFLKKVSFIENIFVLYSVTFLFTFAVSMVILTVYFLIKPILKDRIIIIISKKHVKIYILFAVTVSATSLLVNNIEYPVFNNYRILLIFLILFYIPLVFYFAYISSYISRSYKKIGFVHKAFLPPSIGTIAIILVALLIINIGFFQITYYYLLMVFLFSTFTFIYYFLFIVEYPSLLQPKWKALAPFDPVRLATTFTAVFLVVSLYFTALDLGITFTIPYWVYALVALLFIPLVSLFFYSKAFAEGTTLRYWSYLKTEMTAHLFLTFYVLSTAVVLWSIITSFEKTLYVAFFGLSLFFYVTATLDIQKLTSDLKIKVRTKGIDIARYAISFFAMFFIIFFLVILTKERTIGLDKFLAERSYFPLALIVLFFIFYFVYLRYTHRGFEELMEKGKYTTASYIASLLVFIVFFLIYRSYLGSNFESMQFPLIGTVFLGYFIILVADVYSISTLRVKEYKKGARKDIVDLVNAVAAYFFRTDILEKTWDEIVEKYKYIDSSLEKARFYPPDRTFQLDMVGERARVTAAVAMLLEMEKISKKEKTAAIPYKGDIKEEMESILGEKVLLLPDVLLENFYTKRLYSDLFITSLNRINEAIRPFVSIVDYEKILEKLRGIDEFFEKIYFEEETLKIEPKVEFTDSEFLKNLKLYIQAMEDVFPFNRILLREKIKTEVTNNLAQYGFTLADILNVVPTGVVELDDMVYGGLLKGTTTLFISEERRSKNDLVFHYAAEGLREMTPVIFATSRGESKRIEKLFETYLGTVRGLSIIDLYLATHTERGTVSVSVTEGVRQVIPATIIQVRKAIVSAIKIHPKGVHKRVILDIYNDLSKYQSFEDIRDLIITQVDGFKRWNCTSIVVLPPNLSSVDLERYFDNVFILGEMGSFRIKKLYGGKPKKETFVIWENYSPVEDPVFSPFLAVEE